jgi:hypothetical protein
MVFHTNHSPNPNLTPSLNPLVLNSPLRKEKKRKEKKKKRGTGQPGSKSISTNPQEFEIISLSG